MQRVPSPGPYEVLCDAPYRAGIVRGEDLEYLRGTVTVVLLELFDTSAHANESVFVRGAYFHLILKSNQIQRVVVVSQWIVRSRDLERYMRGDPGQHMVTTEYQAAGIVH